MKQCKLCKTTKEDSEFNGRRSDCKLCEAKYFRSWYAENHEEVLRKRREYNSSPRGQAVLRKSKAKHKNHELARLRVSQAIKSGRITKPNECTACKRHITLEGHHIDYEQPLLVIWLCKRCHNVLHRRVR